MIREGHVHKFGQRWRKDYESKIQTNFESVPVFTHGHVGIAGICSPGAGGRPVLHNITDR